MNMHMCCVSVCVIQEGEQREGGRGGGLWLCEFYVKSEIVSMDAVVDISLPEILDNTVHSDGRILSFSTTTPRSGREASTLSRTMAGTSCKHQRQQGWMG
jgi:hypothetical protein